MLHRAYMNGGKAALEKHALAQPSLGSVGIKSPVKAPGLPGPGSVKTPTLTGAGKPAVNMNPGPLSLGAQAAKVASNVGVGMMTPGYDAATGAVPGQPADAGRRQRSVIDRTFQQNDDFFATSSMPAPGGQVSP